MDERKRVAAEAKAELSFSQALWYAWGYLDNGLGLGPSLKAKIDPFEFAGQVKAATLSFELEETFHLESIQGAWKKYLESK